jgi:hypothetical protein
MMRMQAQTKTSKLPILMMWILLPLIHQSRHKRLALYSTLNVAIKEVKLRFATRPCPSLMLDGTLK